MSRSLTDLRPAFGEMAIAWMNDCATHGLDILITNTFRSAQEQNELYKIGRTIKGAGVNVKYSMGRTVTNAKGGSSAHNFGLALDFVPTIGGKPMWQEDAPQWMQAIVLAEKRGMQSLYNSPFPELCHLQHPQWKQIAGIV